MHSVEFIPARWLEHSAAAVGTGLPLVCHSRPVEVERRVETRRASDVELLLKSLRSK
jgi:hypothetical protein